MGVLLDETSNMDLMVLPIVGMGGLGKTTFVQLIYNDPSIVKHFELRRWCCVSDDFDVCTIANNISQTSKKHREEALQELRNIVSGKRYLIVLDDVWNRDSDKWGKLKTCLKLGGKGSVVLTTTRDAQVARIMKAGVAEAHCIEKLSDGHLREIIQSRAFSLEKANSHKLDGIVDKIVGRCSGSPLAAKAFGSMLSTRTSMKQWEDILDKSNMCNERTGILPILKLSFDDLPAHMKQCFAFCAIFPKDHEIDMDLLIQLWMAHDFIPLQEDDHPEIIGKDIFEELTWRSFFQDLKQTLPVDYRGRLSLHKRTICKIHDLMHDLALSVMGKECITVVDKPNMEKLPNITRHVFLSTRFFQKGQVATLDNILKKQSPMLQTLFCTEAFNDPIIDMSMYTSLRAINFPVRGSFPGPIQHLRYLNLSGNLGLKKLPDDISIMYNLQTLNLSSCRELHHLPKDMKYMSSLRHLYTNGCKSLTCMPPGLGHITCLQTLTYFVVGASSGCSTISELRNLNLGGEIELSGLENVTEGLAKAVSLDHKEKITHLSLKWNIKDQEEPVQDCHKNVLYALKPHDGLHMLRIENYKGTSLPAWITKDSPLKNLTELHLLGCMLCDKFPQFCYLKALQVLYLKRLDRLRSLCSGMVSMVSTPFPALKELQLHDLESLERWMGTEGKEDELIFTVLEEVDIKNCPMLTTLPEAPKLKFVRLDEDRALLSLAIVKSRHVSSLSRLRLSICDTEATPPQIDQNHESSLSELRLEGCHFFFPSSPSQPTFGVWKWFGQLVDLIVRNCDGLMYWPVQVFKSLVSLKTLYIQSCNNLIGPTRVKCSEPTETTVQVLPHLNLIEISHCERLAELFILPPSLRVIAIRGCPRLESIWGNEEQQPEAWTSLGYGHDPASTSMLEQSPSPTHRHPSLVFLQILNCGSMVTLPNLPPSLEHLSIIMCQELRSVSGQLDALKVLDINACSKMESLDSLGELPSLENLYLSRCRCLASLPGGRGSYSGLRRLEISFCPAIDKKQLSEIHEQLRHSLEYDNTTHARSSIPGEGPKLREPKSWKYVLPWCRP